MTSTPQFLSLEKEGERKAGWCSCQDQVVLVNGDKVSTTMRLTTLWSLAFSRGLSSWCVVVLTHSSWSRCHTGCVDKLRVIISTIKSLSLAKTRQGLVASNVVLLLLWMMWWCWIAIWSWVTTVMCVGCRFPLSPDANKSVLVCVSSALHNNGKNSIEKRCKLEYCVHVH